MYKAHLEENDGYAAVYPENDSEESRESMETPDIIFDIHKKARGQRRRENLTIFEDEYHDEDDDSEESVESMETPSEETPDEETPDEETLDEETPDEDHSYYEAF